MNLAATLLVLGAYVVKILLIAALGYFAMKKAVKNAIAESGFSR